MLLYVAELNPTRRHALQRQLLSLWRIQLLWVWWGVSGKVDISTSCRWPLWWLSVHKCIIVGAPMQIANPRLSLNLRMCTCYCRCPTPSKAKCLKSSISWIPWCSVNFTLCTSYNLIFNWDRTPMMYNSLRHQTRLQTYVHQTQRSSTYNVQLTNDASESAI